MDKKYAAIAVAVILVVCSCARMGKETVGMPRGFTIDPLGERVIRAIPRGEMTGTPSFVTIPNPFSAFHAFFHLPADALTRIELRDDRGGKVATLVDGPMRKGVYQIRVGEPNTLGNGKKYTLRLIVGKKLAGTKEFTIVK